MHGGEGVFWSDDADFDRFDLAGPEAGAPNSLSPAALSVSVAARRWLARRREAAAGLHCRRVTIPKRDGGERAILAPPPRLRAAQRWIRREIVEHLPVHGAAHGFLPGRSTQTHAAARTGAEGVQNVGRRDLFPTVTFRRVRGVSRCAGCREQIATLLALLCTEAPHPDGTLESDAAGEFTLRSGPGAREQRGEGDGPLRDGAGGPDRRNPGEAGGPEGRPPD